MNPANEERNVLEVLREAPAEVSLDQVGLMVAAFPLAAGLTAWLAIAKIHLNSIIMTTLGTIILGTGAFFWSTKNTDPAPVSTLPVEAPPVEVAADMPEPTEPAVVFDRPETPATQKAILPVACTVRDTTLATEVAPDALQPNPAPMTAPQPAPHQPTGSTTSIPALRAAQERTFNLQGFTGITVASSVSVTLEMGDYHVSATGDERALEGLEVHLSDGMLEIHQQSKSHAYDKERIAMLIRMPQVRELVVRGSGSIQGGTLRAADGMDLSVLGSGDIQIAHVPHVVEIHVLVEGSGTVELGSLGSSDRLATTTLGSGSITVGKAEVKDELQVTVQGSGDVHCGMMNVAGTARVELLGSGDAQVGGRADRIDVLLTGSGDVHANDLHIEHGGTAQVIGSGDVHVQDAASLEIIITGSGEIHTSGGAATKGSRGVETGTE